MDRDGNVYYNSSNKYKIIDNNQSIKEYKIDGYLASPDGSNVFLGYKLNISNVILMYYADVGNSGDGCFIFIKENGNVSTLTINPDIMEKIKIIDFNDNIVNLKNIVSVIESDTFGSHNITLIDINGFKYDLKGNKLN